MKMKNDEILKAQVEEDEKIWLEYALRKRAKEKPPGLLARIFGVIKPK